MYRSDVLVPTSRHTVFTNGFSVHAYLETFFQTAVLTTVSLFSGHFAGAVSGAAVHSSIAYGTFEEAFASFAGDDAVVEAGGAVAADQACFYFFVASYRISAQTITFPLPNMRLRLVRLMLSHQTRHMGQAQIRQTWKTIHEILRRR